MIYFKYIRMQLRSLAQYRSTFWFMIMGQSLTCALGFASMTMMFDRFHTVAGWTYAEAALCYAAVFMAFSIAECVARGFDSFSRLIVSGDFDRLLLRPRALTLQVLGSSFELTRLGRLIVGGTILQFAARNLGVAWTADKVVVLIMMILSGVVIFFGVFMLGAAMCFVTVEGLEIVNVFTDGGREIASYPLPIYGKTALRFFTFIIPYGCFNYLPLLYLVGRADGHAALYALSPLIGMLFVIPCAFVWKAGVRRYLSTGN
ncbi:MAG: ABC-2 family transporter protein [Oscillospiraceae bacterium]|nr:ABC-2 family transporter protein [Oscillospiraceae bacterium]